MLTSSSPSRTSNLDEVTIARFRAHDFWLAADRRFSKLPDLVKCDGCPDGIAQVVMVDLGQYEGVEGSAIVGDSELCPVCAAIEMAKVGA